MITIPYPPTSQRGHYRDDTLNAGMAGQAQDARPLSPVDQALNDAQERIDMLERNVDALCCAFITVLQVPAPQAGPDKPPMLPSPAASPLAQAIRNIAARVSTLNDTVTSLIHRNTL